MPQLAYDVPSEPPRMNSGDSDTHLLLLRHTATATNASRNCFAEHDTLDGTGTREFAVLRAEGELYVVRVNFIRGSPAAATTALSSQLYQ